MERLKKYEYSMDSCNHCGQCKWILPPKMKGWDFAQICPIHQYYGFDAYSGQGLLNISKEVLTGRLHIGEGLEKVLYSCTACGACDVNCKSVRDIEVLETIHTLRELCAEAGTDPDCLAEDAERILKSGNIFGEDNNHRFDWLPEDYEDDAGADTVLFVGCSGSRHPEIPAAAAKLLRAGGVKFKILRDERCCGAAVWRSGMRRQAEEIIKSNIELFREAGVKRIVTACGECFGAFRAIYPAVCGMDIEVVHMSQIALELLKSGAIELEGNGEMKLTYHDPCMLGRLSEDYVSWEGEIKPFGRHVPEKQWRRGENGVYSEPRELLRAIPGVQLAEMTRNMENAYCCGAPSACTDPEMSAFAAAERRREILSTGANTVVSCCPFCEDALKGDGVESIDLCVLLARHLKEGGAR